MHSTHNMLIPFMIICHEEKRKINWKRKIFSVQYNDERKVVVNELYYSSYFHYKQVLQSEHRQY